MRIVRGTWAGVPLASPAGRVRPTAEALRDAWLSLLEPELPGARVLDLFAGTGALGLEALSRGARATDFVENQPSALHALKANVAKVGGRDRTRIFKRDALEFAARLRPGAYDLVLADPPYGSRMLDRLVERWLAEPYSRVLSVEHAADQTVPGKGRRHRFGDSAVTMFRAALTSPPAPAATRTPAPRRSRARNRPRP